MAILTCPNCGAKNRVNEALAGSLRPKCGRCGASLEGAGETSQDSGKPLTITDDTFETVLRDAGERPVLVDCWATWCPPCRAIAPTIDALAAESGGRYVVAKLDVDANPRTAMRYGVRSIPTLLLFRDGEVVDTFVGARAQGTLEAEIDRVLAPTS